MYDQNKYTEFPDIAVFNADSNPTLHSPNSYLDLSFYETRDTLLDVEEYKHFLDNAIARFRHSITYTNYKSHLMGLGLDRCQYLGNITAEMAPIEMNHVIITIFDVALIITEHTLNTYGKISTFDLVTELKKVHRKNLVPINMFAVTPHQLYHEDPNSFVSPKQVFGKWWELLEKYRYGITQEVAFKIIYYINRAMEEPESDDNGLLDLRQEIMNWSELTDAVANCRQSVDGSNSINSNSFMGNS